MKRIVFSLFLAVWAVTGFAQAKYIFYFIGDGMGQNQVLTTEMYRAELEGQINRRPLIMTQFPVSGQVVTFSRSNGITDSSAAGTCLASGEKTKNGTLGLRPDGTPVVTIAERLKKKGWGIGIMTSVSIDHATPAAFYAHVDRRNEYYKIGTQLAESDFDFFGGATFYQPYPKENRTDKDKSLYEIVRERDYTIAHGYQEYLDRNRGAKKMILIQEHEGHSDDYEGKGMIPYRIDRKPNELTLTQITKASIDFLSQRYDHFFMMVEGGAIDWACHSNDAATVMQDVIDMDEALREAYEFYLRHPDETLIVVTADHETGGLGMGNSDYTLNLQILQNQKISLFQLSTLIKKMHDEKGKKLKWADVKQVLTEKLGFYGAVQLTKEEDKALQDLFKQTMKGKKGDVKTLYASIDGLASAAVGLLNEKSKLGWTTGAHSAAAVPIYAIGVGAEQFTGWQDNTVIAPKIMQVTK